MKLISALALAAANGLFTPVVSFDFNDNIDWTDGLPDLNAGVGNKWSSDEQTEVSYVMVEALTTSLFISIPINNILHI